MDCTDEIYIDYQKELNYGTVIVWNGLPALYSASISHNDGLDKRLYLKCIKIADGIIHKQVLSNLL